MHVCMYVSACAMLCYVMYVRVSYDMLCFGMLSMHTCMDEMHVCVSRYACIEHIHIYIFIEYTHAYIHALNTYIYIHHIHNHIHAHINTSDLLTYGHTHIHTLQTITYALNSNSHAIMHALQK